MLNSMYCNLIHGVILYSTMTREYSTDSKQRWIHFERDGVQVIRYANDLFFDANVPVQKIPCY